MYRYEKLAETRPYLKIEYVVPPSHHMGGLLIDDFVYLDRHQSNCEMNQWLQEEFAHYDYTVGDISKQETLDDRKQEKLARSRAMERTVTLDGLIDCFAKEMWTPEEIADYFDVTIEYLFTALQNYKDKRGVIFKHRAYYFDLRRNVNITRME